MTLRELEDKVIAFWGRPEILKLAAAVVSLASVLDGALDDSAKRVHLACRLIVGLGAALGIGSTLAAKSKD